MCQLSHRLVGLILTRTTACSNDPTALVESEAGLSEEPTHFRDHPNWALSEIACGIPKKAVPGRQHRVLPRSISHECLAIAVKAETVQFDSEPMLRIGEVDPCNNSTDHIPDLHLRLRIRQPGVMNELPEQVLEDTLRFCMPQPSLLNDDSGVSHSCPTLASDPVDHVFDIGERCQFAPESRVECQAHGPSAGDRSEIDDRPGYRTDGPCLHFGFSGEEGDLMIEYEQRRLVNHRLAILQHAEEVTGNVARTCRYYGISRQTFYKWLRRYEEQGLERLRDRSSRPHQSPNATNAEVVGKIVYLRQSYHFGAAQDRDVSQALPRHLGEPVWGVADPETSRLEATQLAAAQAPSAMVETLRETPAGPSGPGRRQVHHPNRCRRQEVPPVHCDR